MRVRLPTHIADQLSDDYCNRKDEVFPMWECAMTDLYDRSIWRGRQAEGWRWLPAWILPWNRNGLNTFKAKPNYTRQRYHMYDHR
jgi:hypothetical protein